MSMPAHLTNYRVIGTCQTENAELLIRQLDQMGYPCSLGTATFLSDQVPAVRIRYHYAECNKCEPELLQRLGGMVEMFHHVFQ